VICRHNLGVIEEEHYEHPDLAMKHFKLAAVAGHKPSSKRIWKYFPSDGLSKADLEKILRAHKEACDEMNSEDRERLTAAKEAEAGDDAVLKHIYLTYYQGLMNAKELNVSLKAHRRGDVGQVRAILAKCWKACTK